MISFLVHALLYFLPTMIAAHRDRGIAGILLLNLLFGWTVIGWFALLLYAVLSHPTYRVPAPYWYR